MGRTVSTTDLFAPQLPEPPPSNISASPIVAPQVSGAEKIKRKVVTTEDLFGKTSVVATPTQTGLRLVRPQAGEIVQAKIAEAKRFKGTTTPTQFPAAAGARPEPEIGSPNSQAAAYVAPTAIPMAGLGAEKAPLSADYEKAVTSKPPRFMAIDNPAGLLAPGNIDLGRRPKVKTSKGIATVRSISINIDGNEVLIPTVSEDGRLLRTDQAVRQYRRTGKHLGIFKDVTSADAYAQTLHEQQQRMYAPLKPTKGAIPSAASGFMETAIDTLASIPRGLAESRGYVAVGQLTEMDRLDAGEDPVVIATGSNGTIDIPKLARLRAYQELSPGAKAKARAENERLIDPKNNRLSDIATAMGQAGHEMFGVPDPARKEEIGQKVADTFGSVAGFMAGGAVGRALKIPAWLTVASLGMLVNGDQMFQDALTHGASLETAYRAYLAGLPAGASEAIPIAKWLDRFDKATGGRIKQAVINSGIDGLEEFIQEHGQNIWNDAAAKGLYDPERDVLLMPGEQPILAGGSGAVIGLFTSLLPGRAHEAVATQPDVSRETVQRQGGREQPFLRPDQQPIREPEAARPPTEPREPATVATPATATVVEQTSAATVPMPPQKPQSKGVPLTEAEKKVADNLAEPSAKLPSSTQAVETQAKETGGQVRQFPAAFTIDELDPDTGTLVRTHTIPAQTVSEAADAFDAMFPDDSGALRRGPIAPVAPTSPQEGRTGAAAPEGLIPAPPVPTTSAARPTSWVIREKETGRAVLETHDERKVRALNTAKYEAVPITQHLQELNAPGTKAAVAARQPQERSTDRKPLSIDEANALLRGQPTSAAPAVTSAPAPGQQQGAPPASLQNREPAAAAQGATHPAYGTILRAVRQRGPGSISPKAVAKRFGLDVPTATAILDSIVATGEGNVRKSKSGEFVKRPAKPPRNLFQFIASLGGIRDDTGDIAAILDKRSPAYRQIVRRGGRSPDEVRRAAVEFGYLSKDADMIPALHEAIRLQASGQNVYAEHGAEVSEIEAVKGARDADFAEGEAQARYGDIIEEGRRQGVPVDIEVAKLAANLLAEHPSWTVTMAVHDAWSRISLERSEQEAQNAPTPDQWKPPADVVAGTNVETGPTSPPAGETAAGPAPGGPQGTAISGEPGRSDTAGARPGERADQPPRASPDETVDEEPPFQRTEDASAPTAGPRERVRLADDVIAETVKSLDPKARAMVDAIATLAERIAPGAKVRVYQRLFGFSQTQGVFEGRGVVTDAGLRAVINLALHPSGKAATAEELAGTMRHEAIHWLRQTGIISEADWAKLAAAAERENWIKRHGIERNYPNASHEVQIEEAVAEQFRKFRAAPETVPSALRSVYGKVAAFLRGLAGTARRIFGAEATANDILNAIERGTYQRGGPRAQPSGRPAAAFQKDRTTDQAAQGEQRVLPGAERITDRELIERKSEGPAKAKTPQKDTSDLPLFDTNAPKQGSLWQRAFHASPHDFHRFELSNRTALTGEGAMAYGYGLYFANRKSIAEHYRKTFSQGQQKVSYNGRAYDEDTIDREWMGKNLTDAQAHALHFMYWEGGIDEAAAKLKSEIAEYKNANDFESATLNQNALAWLNANKNQLAMTGRKARLYEVEIPENEDFLDWDKPLSEQSEKVRRIIDTLHKFPQDRSGEAIYHDFGLIAKKDQRYADMPLDRAASMYLKDHGIPGHYFADASSRNTNKLRILSPHESVSGKWVVGYAPNGPNKFFETEAEARKYLDEQGGLQKQTNNYVIYDDVAVQITSKWQRAAAGPGLFGNSFEYTSPLVRDELLRSSALTARNVWAKAMTKFDLARVKLQDKMLALKRVEQAIAESRGITALPTAQDAYLGEELYHGITGQKLDEFRAEQVEPLIKHIAEHGLTIEQVNQFLYARHAPERNAQIAKINPDMPDAGSGMSDAEAAETMDRFRADGLLDKLDHVAGMVDAINLKRLDILTQGDLIDAETRMKWRQTYKHYVPLRGWETPDDELTGDARDAVSARPRIGQGYDIRGQESKRAMGRGEGNRAGDILSHVLAQYEEAVVRAEKNKVAKQFLRLVEANPNPDLWEVGVDTATRRIDKSTGLVVHGSNPDLVNRDNVLAAKIGGEVHYVTINDPGLARAMKNLGAESANGLIQALGKVMRYFAAINTQWNPAFAIPNLFRDVQTAMVNVQAEDVPDRGKLAGAIVRDIRKAMFGAFGGQRGRVDTEWQRYYREFAEAGGKISFFGMDDIATRSKKIQKLYENAKHQHKIRSGLRLTGQLLSDINGAVENATRLSVYTNLRRRGVSKEKAASIARNLTVNFNRKGEWGQTLNALYLFYNAAIQGNYAMVRALVKSRRVQGIALGATIAGALLDSLMAALSPDDDKTGEKLWDQIGEWDKAHNLIVVNPWAKSKDELIALKIPLPYGYNIFPYSGLKVGELLRDKPNATAGKAAVDVTGAAVDAFNPIGDSGPLWMLPTLAKPPVEIAANINFTGAPIMPDKTDPAGHAKPDSELYFKSVRAPSQWVAEKINELTGGSKYVEGGISWSPETLDHWFDFATGGLGKFLMAPIDQAIRLKRGDTTTAFDWPVVSRFTATKKDWYVDRRYRELNDTVTAVRKTIESLEDDGDQKTANEWRKRYAIETSDEVNRAFKSADRALSRMYRKTGKEDRDETFDAEVRDIEAEAIKVYIEALKRRHQ